MSALLTRHALGAACCILALLGAYDASAIEAIDPSQTILLKPPLSPPYLLNWRSFESYANEILKKGSLALYSSRQPPFHRPNGPSRSRILCRPLQRALTPALTKKKEALRAMPPLQTALDAPSPTQIPLSPVKGKPYKIAKTQGKEEEAALWLGRRFSR